MNRTVAAGIGCGLWGAAIGAAGQVSWQFWVFYAVMWWGFVRILTRRRNGGPAHA